MSGSGSSPGRRTVSLPWAVVFVAAACAETVLAWVLVSGSGLQPGRWSFPVLFAVWSVIFVVAVCAALRLPRRGAVGLVLVAGIALRLAALAGPPTTSDDLYRYSWDGRVQAAGTDSYADAPTANQLIGLREAWLWPSATGCASLGRPPGCTRINRPDVRTIYPPVAEAWFAAVYRVAGIGARYKAWQVAGVLTEVVTLALLVVALRRWGRDTRWLALYALCPAPVLEIVNNGHVDGLAIALTVAALIVAGPVRHHRWNRAMWYDIAAAALLGAAALVKLYPAVLLLPLVACRRGPRLGAAVRAAGTVALLTAVAYAPHVARVGAKVIGYLPGYLTEEHYHSGGRYLIANLLQVPDAWAGAVSFLGFALVVGWIVVRRPPLPSAAAAILAALLLATSPAQPWYAVTVLALATFATRPAWAAVVGGGYAAAFAVVLDRPGSAVIGGVGYTIALVVIVSMALRRRRSLATDAPSPSRCCPGLE